MKFKTTTIMAWVLILFSCQSFGIEFNHEIDLDLDLEINTVKVDALWRTLSLDQKKEVILQHPDCLRKMLIAEERYFSSLKSEGKVLEERKTLSKFLNFCKNLKIESNAPDKNGASIAKRIHWTSWEFLRGTAQSILDWQRLSLRKKEALDQTEKSSLDLYTSGFYSRINSYLRNDAGKVEVCPFLNSSIENIVSALKKVRPYRGVVYRNSDTTPGGLSFSNLPKMQELREHGPVILMEPAFLSTEISSLDDLAFNTNRPRFKVLSYQGKKIAKYSHYQNENEVLFSPRTLFLYRGLDQNQMHVFSEIPETGWRKEFALWKGLPMQEFQLVNN